MPSASSDQKLPTGVVTFLLTDIEGSTPRWEARPEEMARAVVRHDEILHGAVIEHGGARPLEQGEGDSMVAAFAHAWDAVAAALDAQLAQVRDDVYYVGPPLIRCARLRALVGAAGAAVGRHGRTALR